MCNQERHERDCSAEERADYSEISLFEKLTKVFIVVCILTFFVVFGHTLMKAFRFLSPIGQVEIRAEVMDFSKTELEHYETFIKLGRYENLPSYKACNASGSHKSEECLSLREELGIAIQEYVKEAKIRKR